MIPATFIWIETRTVSVTGTSTELSRAWAKPSFVAVNTYLPGASNGNRKRPSASLVVERLTSRSKLFASIDALGIPLPVGSRISPTKEPVEAVWPQQFVTAPTTTHNDSPKQQSRNEPHGTDFESFTRDM